MPVTFSKDPREPLSSVAIQIHPAGHIAIVGAPGWLTKIPTAVLWETNGLGVRVFDQNGAKIGDAPTNSIEDFEKAARVYLRDFDDRTGKFADLGECPLKRKPG